MQIISIALLIASFIIVSVTSTHAQQKCTQDDSIKAEQTVSTLNTWDQVYDSFRHYSQCDDGAVAEGYDDKIVDLLVAQWGSVGELFRLSTAHPLFEQFVLKHINTLMSPDQTMAVIENAHKHCPVKAKELCLKLENKVRNPG